MVATVFEKPDLTRPLCRHARLPAEFLAPGQTGKFSPIELTRRQCLPDDLVADATLSEFGRDPARSIAAFSATAQISIGIALVVLQPGGGELVERKLNLIAPQTTRGEFGLELVPTMLAAREGVDR